MNLNATVLVLVALVAAALLLGLLVRGTQTRGLRAPRKAGSPGAERLEPSVFASEGGPAAAFGARLTLIQFSTEFCARCPATARTLSAEARAHRGVEHLEVDVTRRDELIERFSILRTPTVLVLDEAGRLRSRVSGPSGSALARALVDRHLAVDADHRTTDELERSIA